MSTWTRTDPPVTDGPTNVNHQTGPAFDAIWSADLGADSLAIVRRSYYRAQQGDRGEYLECQTEYVLHTAAGMEVGCTYAFLGDVDSNSEVFGAAYDAPAPTDEEFVAGLLAKAA